MRRRPARSVQTVAFVTAFCALGVAAGCGQETFNLLPDDSPLTIAGRSAGGASGGAGAGGSSAASGKAGTGGAGRSSVGGFGGRFGNPQGGATGSSPCLGEGGCPDEEPPICWKSSPFPYCIPCRSPKDCSLAGEANVCDPVNRRCVQCINEFQCGVGEACNIANQRCAKACDSNKDCGGDGQRLQCSRELGGVCVSCIRETDCMGYGPFTHCNQSVCVECLDDRQCMGQGQTCVSGRCISL